MQTTRAKINRAAIAICLCLAPLASVSAQTTSTYDVAAVKAQLTRMRQECPKLFEQLTAASLAAIQNDPACRSVIAQMARNGTDDKTRKSICEDRTASLRGKEFDEVFCR